MVLCNYLKAFEYSLNEVEEKKVSISFLKLGLNAQEKFNFSFILSTHGIMFEVFFP